ncbi:MAG: ATP-grasp domain-containing protein [Methyloligellaceae bacterium]
MKPIFVIHENEEWFPPLKAALETVGLEYRELHMGAAKVDLSGSPEDGIYYNRMSASSWTRAHAAAPQLTLALLEQLELHGRRVVNGSRALDLEISKARQCAAMARAGIRFPRSFLAVGKDDILAAARSLNGPIILKPDCGGKGAGVQLFASIDELANRLRNNPALPPAEELMPVQAYIEPAEPFIIRNEFVGGEHLYSVRVDTSDGFELCPADVCEIGDGVRSLVAPVNKFEVLTDFNHPNLDPYKELLRNEGIEIAGIEMITDGQGQAWTYDININTNYNGKAEEDRGIAGTEKAGMMAIADFLGHLAGQRLPSRIAAE